MELSHLMVGITSFILKHMKNKDLIETLQKLNPEADVVLSTGDTYDDVEDITISWGGRNFGDGATGMNAETVFIHSVKNNNSEAESPKVHRLIKVNAGPRYFEDAEVNGENDISYEEQQNGLKPKMPCVKAVEVERGIFTKKMVTEYRWCLEIDGDTGKILNWEKGTEAVAYYKVCDDCMIEYFVDGRFVCNNDGYWYVPDFLCLDDEGYGDYMDITIDKEGQIKNWSLARLLHWAEEQQKNKDKE